MLASKNTEGMESMKKFTLNLDVVKKCKMLNLKFRKNEKTYKN